MKIYKIGRSSDNDIVIDDDIYMVSRYHATLKVYDNGSITVCDNSTNGTYINGTKMAKGVETAVRIGDDILFAGDIPLNWALIDSHSTTFAGNTNINQYQINRGQNYHTPQEMFSNAFSFDGRIRRLEYGLSNIIYGVLALIITQIVGNNDSNAWMFLAFIPMMWFLIAQNTKRCHDVGSSGWYQLIPFYGIYLLFAEGESGANQYGQNPKGE